MEQEVEAALHRVKETVHMMDAAEAVSGPGQEGKVNFSFYAHFQVLISIPLQS
jgi:flavin-binding protein dodecin